MDDPLQKKNIQNKLSLVSPIYKGKKMYFILSGLLINNNSDDDNDNDINHNNLILNLKKKFHDKISLNGRHTGLYRLILTFTDAS